MRAFALVLAVLALAACNKPAGPQVSADAKGAAAEAAAESSGSKPNKFEPGGAGPGPMLAYVYQFGVEAPADHIRALVEKDQAACNDAGPAACAVTGSNIEQAGNDQTNAQLTLKASPAWLAKFQATLADEARAAGGHIAKTSITSEDLSVQIVDADAHTKAQAALRDRLQEALQNRPGRASDFVDAANGLAKAQGDLDAMQSELALLRQRVALSDVTIDYNASEVFASGSTWAPLSQAVHEFSGMMAMALAAIVTIIGFLLPWAVVVTAAAWAILTFRRRQRRRVQKSS